MGKQNNYNIKLGLFITTGVMLFIIGIYLLGMQQNLFGRTYSLGAVFKDVKGLQVGNNVRLLGINVGTVNSINIINDSTVHVKMVIKQDVRDFIKHDAKATIGSEGLMGNKVVNIIPGTASNKSAKENQILETTPPVEIDDILGELKKSSQNASVVTKNLIEITGKINRGQGVFGKLFIDTVFTNNLDRISSNTARLTNNVATLTRKINKEEGILGKLFSDSAFAKEFETMVTNVKNSSSDINYVTNKLKTEKGAFAKMIMDSTDLENLETISADLANTASNLAIITRKINSGDGLFNTLIDDSVFVDTIKTTIDNLNRGIKKLNATSDAVKDSWFIRTFSNKDNDKNE